MEIGAKLAQLELASSDPQALSAFYAATFGLKSTHHGEAIACSAPGRRLLLVPGKGGELRRASYRFAESSKFEAHRELLLSRDLQLVEDRPAIFTVRDPEGRLISFLAPGDTAPAESDAREARLQHVGVRSPAPAALAEYYVGTLGFVLSDRVVDEKGELTAAFLRTDSEHHSLAIFRAAAVRFDHFSCEAPGWYELREWADHMAKVGVDLAWGVGRHGPGNDTFLMVKDPDGNLAEISSDLEVCTSERPTGVWPHRPQTLNQWGVALMRS